VPGLWPATDLFAWRAERDARAAVETAIAARAEAERRYRYAPRGEVLNRLSAFQAATEDVLRAQWALRQVTGGYP
jgi:hypothetical protein